MIKVNRLENVYGITKVYGANNLKRNSVIYAPNGTAKSSIADALQLIGDEKNDISSTKDVYGLLPNPTFDIDVDGNSCTETNRVPFKVVKYSGVNEFALVSEGNYANLVASPNVSNQIATAIRQISSAINNIQTLIDGQFPTKNGSSEYREALSIIANTSVNDPDLYLKLVQNVNLATSPLTITVTEKMFVELVSNKVKEICLLDSVVNNATQYFQITNNITINENRPSYFDNNFTLDKLQDLHKNAKKNKYYNDSTPERKLYIDGTVYDEVGIETLINSEISRVYGSTQAKNTFDEIAKAFKNKSRVVTILKENPILISKLNNYSAMIKELFITIINPVISNIQILLDNISIHQTAIQTLKDNYNADDNHLTKIWNDFNSRFKFKKFDLRIDNEFNAVIGKEFPVFVKYIPGTNIRVTNPKELRFSTGEIKTFNLINFIISVEALRECHTSITIILDDAVDSFDYKNKYGIIDYLVDIKDDPNIQLIILTHNFDFYRSAIMALGNDVGQYFAYRNSNNEINFYDTSGNRYLLSVANFNAWKNSPSISQYFALIPFSRNVLQLSTRSSNPIVQSINEYIHYENTLETKHISNLDSILQPNMNINKPTNLNGTDKYLFELNRLIEKILSGSISVNETDLEYKISMGLYVRIFLERYLYLNYERNTGNPPVITDVTRKTRLLIQANYPYMTSEEKKYVLEANVISPAYAHINSFMYEPLIDVGTSELLESVRWIHDKNNEWAL